MTLQSISNLSVFVLYLKAKLALPEVLKENMYRHVRQEVVFMEIHHS